MIVTRVRPKQRSELRRPQRSIYSAQHSLKMPGVLIRTEGSPPVADTDVNDVYDHLGTVIEFYRAIFARNSIDGNGQPIVATVHYGTQYQSVFWTGTQLVFGDGDTEAFAPFTGFIDVVAYEFTRGIIDVEAHLPWFSQSGALSSSIADVFGSLIKQYVFGQTADQSDWLIGAGLLKKGGALRSMKSPGTAYDDPVLGKDPQPAHMKDYIKTDRDSGGVHINSGIPNRAFYLSATEIGGYAWEKAGKIWYETLRDSRLRPNTGFRRFATLTVEQAGKLFGPYSNERRAVQKAWIEVGVIVPSTD